MVQRALVAIASLLFVFGQTTDAGRRSMLQDAPTFELMCDVAVVGGGPGTIQAYTAEMCSTFPLEIFCLLNDVSIKGCAAFHLDMHAHAELGRVRSRILEQLSSRSFSVCLIQLASSCCFIVHFVRR